MSNMDSRKVPSTNVDRFYAKYAELVDYDRELLIQAGWLDLAPVTSPVSFDMPLVADLGPIAQSSHNDVNVLISTGGYAPLHAGHVEAMERARIAVQEATGAPVVAGYFSPDSDDYMAVKQVHEWPAVRRVSEAQRILAGSNWLRVNTQPSLWASGRMNFTHIYDWFNSHLTSMFPHRNIKLWYVYGSDNYMFANAFLEHGYGVCVLRGGHSSQHNETINILEHDRILVTDEDTIKLSSSFIRDNPALMTKYDATQPSSVGSMFFRDDSMEAFSDCEVQPTYSHVMKVATWLGEAAKCSVDCASLSAPSIPGDDETISLDAFVPGDFNIRQTRIFNAHDGQWQPCGRIAALGESSILQQVAKIPSGTYTVFDDDVATGGTAKYVTTLLETHNIVVKQYLAMVQSEYGDIVDFRDFILGGKHAGLTVREPFSGTITRMPYLFPYVNLITRASLPPEACIPFSLQVWQLNAKLYGPINMNLSELADRGQDFRVWGFPGDMSVTALCQWHVKWLTVLAGVDNESKCALC